MSNQAVLQSILASWKEGRNALLYGPPGTGKTLVLSELYSLLKIGADAEDDIQFDPDDATTPLTLAALEIPIPLPAKVVWTTFHQSYGYEDFVLGLRPESDGGAVILKPWMGVLLDAAYEVHDAGSQYNSTVVFIDEINRGNAARIFGEFLTFLDFDYRAGGDHPLAVPLRQLAYDTQTGLSEPLKRIGGEEAQIPQEFEFPRHVYIVSTMNSVDRAAVPIDSALARRFDRIELRPDLRVLADWWGLDLASLPPTDDANWANLTAYETGIYLLDRLNALIGTEFGPEFELGHGLLMGLRTGDPNEWVTLAMLWDDVLYPQIEDRYAGNQEALIALLKVEEPPTGDYAWRFRTRLGGAATGRAVTPAKLADLDPSVIARSLRWLAR